MQKGKLFDNPGAKTPFDYLMVTVSFLSLHVDDLEKKKKNNTEIRALKRKMNIRSFVVSLEHNMHDVSFEMFIGVCPNNKQ